MSESATSLITQYVSSRVDYADGSKVSILSSSTLDNTCYRDLVLNVPGVGHPIHIYLSPDQRFIFTEAYDLHNGRRDIMQANQTATASLVAVPGPRRGSPTPKVEIVEFLDFECPFCRQAASWYDSLPASLRDVSALVIKQLPLPQHPWALEAANITDCIYRENHAAFWTAYSYLFGNQALMTPQTVVKEALQAERFPAAENDRISACLAHGDENADLARDRDLGKLCTSRPLFIAAK